MTRTIDIKAIRDALGLSQERLADLLGGLHQSTVSRLESGATKPKGLVLKTLLDLQAEAASRREGEAA